MESIIIKITYNKNMNLSQNMHNTDIIFEYYIEKELKIKKMFLLRFNSIN